MPPICIMTRMTSWPKRDQFVYVSAMISPVTHVALVEVNSASNGLVHCPIREDTGRQSRTVPVRMTRIKLRAMILVGLIRYIHL